MSLVLSLFPGIGLLDMAFEEEGFCTVRGPDVIWGGDIRRFVPENGAFDGVIGGPPCQCFSALANLVRANGHEPKFGNLIPEFERCVSQAAPEWFLMENVPQAPAADVPGYGIHTFVIDHCALDGGDGFGLEQERKRRFSFGLKRRAPMDLRRWIQPAALLLSARAPTTTSTEGGRRYTIKLDENGTPHPMARTRTSAVLSDRRETPVALGGSGKLKPSRTGPVTGAHAGEGRGRTRTVTGNVGGISGGGRVPTVTGSDGAATGMRPMTRYKLADALRLQGLPEDFLSDAPFTAEGKLKAVANGVPLPLGRAIAKAIRECLKLSREATA